MTQVLNPVLLIEEPLYEILLGGEVLGRSPLAGRDSGMGLALGPFTPTFAFTKVEDVFALFAEASKDAGDTSKVNEYYKKRDALGLKLRSPEGADIATDWIHITDFRSDLGADACEIEVRPSDPEFFPEAD